MRRRIAAIPQMGDGENAKRGLESSERAWEGFRGAGGMFLKIDGCRISAGARSRRLDLPG
jgi:hypothetical protein